MRSTRSVMIILVCSLGVIGLGLKIYNSSRPSAPPLDTATVAPTPPLTTVPTPVATPAPPVTAPAPPPAPLPPPPPPEPPKRSPKTILAEAADLADTPALRDRYADDHLAGLNALDALRDEYLDALTEPTQDGKQPAGAERGGFDQALSPDLQDELEPATLKASRACAADLRACLIGKANQPEVLAGLGGGVCNRAAYALSQVDTQDRLSTLRDALQQAEQTDCLEAMIRGLVDAQRGEDLGAILSGIDDVDTRLGGTHLAIERLHDGGDAEADATVKALLSQRVEDLSRTEARADLLRLLAIEGEYELGRKVIDAGGTGEWLNDMEVFRRDLSHWNHHTEAKNIQQVIKARYPAGFFGRIVHSPDKLAGWMKRVGGDVGRGAGSVLDLSSDIAPTEWSAEGADRDFSAIDRMDEEDRPAALIDVLGSKGTARRHEAARRLLDLSPADRTEEETHDLILQQVRGGRLWAATQLLDQIHDPEARLETAAQAVRDLPADPPR